MPIIRRNTCIYAALGICHSVWMTVWYAGCIPDNHPHRVTNTKCRIDTVISLNDGHIVARNMWRKEINILRKIMHQVCFNLQDYARMHGLQNIKLLIGLFGGYVVTLVDIVTNVHRKRPRRHHAHTYTNYPAQLAQK